MGWWHGAEERGACQFWGLSHCSRFEFGHEWAGGGGGWGGDDFGNEWAGRRGEFGHEWAGGGGDLIYRKFGKSRAVDMLYLLVAQ
jgi:hypothetical protein